MIKITKNLLTEWFNCFNINYFNNELKAPNYVITNNRSRYGQFRPRTWTIEMSTAWVRSERDYMNTFLHEMCHLYVRQTCGWQTQSHGYEWKEIANKITKATHGKYGIIQRVGGGQDKVVLRIAKTNKFVIFTDCYGNVGIAKYTDEKYIAKLKRLNAIQSGTTITYVVSDDVALNKYPFRSAHTSSARWSRLGLTMEEVAQKSECVKTEFYTQLAKNA